MINDDEKITLQQILAKSYPGTVIVWTGAAYTLVIPDELADRSQEISTMVERCVQVIEKQNVPGTCSHGYDMREGGAS